MARLSILIVLVWSWLSGDPPPHAICLTPLVPGELPSGRLGLGVPWAPACGDDLPVVCELGVECEGLACACTCDHDGDCREAELSVARHYAGALPVGVGSTCEAGRCVWGSDD